MSASLQDETGARVACFLRQEYPANTAKLVAGRLDISVDTAKGYLRGNLPRRAQPSSP